MTPLRRKSDRPKRNLKYIMLEADTEAAELGLSVTAILWGLVLLMPWHTFDHSATYAGLKAVAPEYLWGSFVAVMASTRIWALLVDNYGWRQRCAFMASITWMFVAGCFAATDFKHTGMAVYPMAAAANIWIYVRLVRAKRRYHV
jgi:hypothetical protein